MGVFFKRTAFDDPDGANPADANWFNHYAVDHMSAVDHLRTAGSEWIHFTDVTYEYDQPSSPGAYCDPYTTSAQIVVNDGWVSNAYTTVSWQSPLKSSVAFANYRVFGDQAPPTVFSTGALTINIRARSGIDTSQWATTHELEHVRQSGLWHPPDGFWYDQYGQYNSGPGTADYDGDQLPNAYEDSLPSDWRNSETWATFYHCRKNDQEPDAEKNSQSFPPGRANNDFGYPGRLSTGD